MKAKIYYNNIRLCIRCNSIRGAIEELHKMADEFNDRDIDNELLLIESQFQEINSLEIKGMETSEYIEVRKNKIKFNILHISDLLLDKSNKIYTNKNVSIIKKWNNFEKIKLSFIKLSTKEKFTLELNPHLSAESIVEEIMLSFEPNFKDNFLFREKRVKLHLVKINTENSSIRLNDKLNLIDNGINENDTVAIDIELFDIVLKKSARILYCKTVKSPLKNKLKKNKK